MRGNWFAITIALLGLSFSVPAHADCTAQSSATTRPHLVELYTSEGCSSCPPADTWLRHLPRDGTIVALAFHVDYWDSLGWRDRFADARFSARQVAESGGTSVYTPQVVLDGHSWRDWYRDAMPPPPRASVTMKLVAVQSEAKLRAHVAVEPIDGIEPAGYRGYLALTEDGLSTEVHAGENRGARLAHDHVVRMLLGPLPLAGGQAEGELMIPGDVDGMHATLVAFAQRSSDGDIAQVVALPLGQCQK